MRRAVVLVVPLIAVTLLPAVASARRARPYDFNGDGRQDLVVGVSGWTDAGQTGAGAAVVLAGGRRGVSLRPQLLVRSSTDVPGEAQAGSGFGSAFASGDFNGDGYADLAIGDQGETVTVLYGSRSGLAGAGAQLIPGPAPPTRIGFGSALAAGDFNADGFTDLAVGAPFEDIAAGIPDRIGSGAVHVLFGGPVGITHVGERKLARAFRRRFRFGESLAVGDVNRDGRLDLVEAARAIGGDEPAFPGHSSFCPGTRRGPVRCRAMRDVGRAGSDRATAGPDSLAIGDVTGDGYPDIVQGVSYAQSVDTESGPGGPGEVRLWRGTRRGPSRRAIVITQNTPGVPGNNEFTDLFGFAVAVARLDRDRYADIVIGAPGEDNSAGRVTIIRGAPSGHARTGNVALERGRRGLPGRRHVNDGLGGVLSLLDINGDHHADLVLGASGPTAPLIVARGRPRHRRFFAARTAQSFGLADLGLQSGGGGLLFGWPLGRVGSS